MPELAKKIIFELDPEHLVILNAVASAGLAVFMDPELTAHVVTRQPIVLKSLALLAFPPDVAGPPEPERLQRNLKIAVDLLDAMLSASIQSREGTDSCT